jgi:PEP-utilising enzyme, PEP-binding domain
MRECCHRRRHGRPRRQVDHHADIYAVATARLFALSPTTLTGLALFRLDFGAAFTWQVQNIELSNTLYGGDRAGFSIGSNDLTQLILGVDRDSELAAHLFDERNDAVKRAIAWVIAAAHDAGRKIGICGQAPSDYQDFAQFLVTEGIVASRSILIPSSRRCWRSSGSKTASTAARNRRSLSGSKSSLTPRWPSGERAAVVVSQRLIE